MKVPLSWLKEVLPSLPSVSKIAETLTLLGIEVEAISNEKSSFSGVVVGKVLEVTPHPNADRLKVAEVSDGSEVFQVVCGAPNCRKDLVTAFAKIGATLEGDDGKAWKIKKSKIREVESHGMLCAASELKLSEEGEGILELPQDAPLGSDFAAWYQDPVFELSLTPNLGHCLSILGVARELSAALEIPLALQTPHLKTKPGKIPFTLEIKNPHLTPRYALREVIGVKVGPSPASVAARLEKAGLKSVNNVVDALNLAMLYTGQPLHAFDASLISGKTLIVGEGSSFTEVVALGSKLCPLTPKDIVIADREKPLAVAGIVGAMSAAITDSTHHVLIESAIFSSTQIRKTARSLGLKTDASYRFERGVDRGGVGKALDYAAALVQELAGGEITEERLDFVLEGFLEPRVVKCRKERVNSLLGTLLSQNEIVSILSRLGMRVSGAEELAVEVPTYRNDIAIEEDLVEEVARLLGYQNLPKKPPLIHLSPLLDTPLYTFEQKMRSKLLEQGLQECITCDLISPTLASLSLEPGMGKKEQISVLHPSSIDQSLLRTSLLPGLLQVAERNLNHGNPNLALFEIGKIHFRVGVEFYEQLSLAILLTGLSRPSHWERKAEPFDFFDLKGIVEVLGAFKLEPSHHLAFHPLRQAHLKQGELTVGSLGEVHPSTLQRLGIEERVYFAELNLQDLLQKGEVKCRPLPSFPGTTRDWTLPLKKEVAIERVMKAITEGADSPLLAKVELIDLYTGGSLPDHQKNATFRFTYRDPKETISLEKAQEIHLKLTQWVAEKLHDCVLSV